MADFALCDACRAEYENPADRRFHAQPNACPDCGPRLCFVDPKNSPQQNNASALAATQRALAAGQIVAIKGIGGFHLACDATNPQAVETLRRRKARGQKPFAVMAASLSVARDLVEISPAAQALLESRAAPIVLLPKVADDPLPDAVAPHNHRLGVMLPYSPLHLLLFQPPSPVDSATLPPNPLPDPTPQVLVMTSGNLRAEPIAIANDPAQTRLAPLADAFLLHDRPIHIACDDSVVAFAETRDSARPILIRRSRGYAPTPLPLPFELHPILAIGGELKNTLCVAQGQHAFLSGHIGDLANPETLHAFEQAREHMQRLFRVTPQVIACDLHPGYLGTRWAGEQAAKTGLQLVQIQHHHAHIAALMAEHQLPRATEIIGVAMDGTGYGPDGTIWGGEFMVAGYTDYQRLGRLQPMPLPGGDATIQRPYRMALAALWQSGIEWDPRLPPVAACPAPERRVLGQQLARNFNCVATSSMGRFFDAVAALIGLCTTATYEAQGAIALEGLAQRAQFHPLARATPYPFRLRTAPPTNAQDLSSNAPMTAPKSAAPTADLGQSGQDQVKFEIDVEPALRTIVKDLLKMLTRTATATATEAANLRGGVQAEIALRTHATVAALITAGCRAARAHSGINRVGLTGGVFQNALLLTMTEQQLTEADFQVLIHRRIPANDGGLALGQAVIAGLGSRT